MEVRIRPLREDDLGRIFGPVARQLARGWLDEQRRGEILVAVAEVDGVPVGRANFRYDIAYLWAAHVDPAWQSRGIGSRLIAHLEEVARRRGASAMRLHVGKENDRARWLYEGLGYRAIGEAVDRWSYVDETERRVEVEEDCWVMEKPLGEP